MIDAITAASTLLGIAATCAALGVPRATYYREVRPTEGPRRAPATPRRLPDEERAAVMALLHEERFVNLAPAEIYATLLDEKRYLCSIRTMYRVLAENEEVRERRDLLRHPNYTKPELLATRPNELWSWDITKLLGPAKWTYFYLYVILDVFSRYVVGGVRRPPRAPRTQGSDEVGQPRGSGAETTDPKEVGSLEWGSGRVVGG